MNKIRITILFNLIAIFTIFTPCVVANAVTLEMSMDSAYILMGKQTTIHLDAVIPKNDTGKLLNYDLSSIDSVVEIVKLDEKDTIDIGNDRLQVKQDITIQSFDSGLYTLPPFLYKIGNETIYSNELVLKVIPVNVDSMTTILGFNDDVFQYESKWYDILPDFVTDYWYVIILLIILLAITLYIINQIIKKRPIISPIIKKKTIPPYELAMQKISKLKEDKVWERGNEKEYYTRLIDILREYLVLRFNISAMEMTSSQIIYAIKNCDETKEHVAYMEELLNITDFVKFAKFTPLPDENIKSMAIAVKFLEETKPIILSENENTKLKQSEK